MSRVELPPTSAWGRRLCSPLLTESQNPDGGWGFQPGLESSVEPACWALLALSHETGTDLERARQQGLAWLQGLQLADGSWPSRPGQRDGCWVTSLCCLAIYALQGDAGALTRGLQWLCKSWPAEGGWLWRLRQKLAFSPTLVSQDSSLRGWSWTPGTSSWVEPTSHALIALRRVPKSLLPRAAAGRLGSGEQMLHDRMCPGGGWNCGNPMVYGVAGEPSIGPTAWALLALQHYSEKQENQRSLDWLEAVYPTIRSPGSIILATLCLEICGRSAPPLDPVLRQLHKADRFSGNTMAVAWSALVLGPARTWLEFPREDQGQP